MKFDASIDGELIRCRIETDRPLAAPVFCFSGMVPMEVLEGGTWIAGLGGYTEVQLPDLTAGTVHAVTLRYANAAQFRPSNRAFLPLGPYLRSAEGTLPLPALPAGVITRRDWPKDCPGLRLCPAPAQADLTGETLAAGGFRADAARFAAVVALAERTGLDPFLDPDGPELTVTADSTLPPEAYRLDIARQGVTLHHGDEAGLFHGAITLLTLLRTHDGALPCGRIDDAPRFGWRGQHLDCARHYIHPDTICRVLDLMALLKLNRFHWHFADDEAFRLTLDSLPELAATHYRGEGEVLPGLFGGGIRAGGSYDAADVARVLDHAAALQIEVMPEIEVPAHALALARVYPGTRDPEDTGTEASVQGYAKNVMNPAMAETWHVWNAMVDEIAARFPFDVVHLGCDELPAGAWQGSPAAQALMAREGLDSTDDLQGWVMARLAGRLAERGKFPAAWEEAARGANGGIGHDAVLFSWTSQGPGLEAAKRGYRVVMCPAQHVYLDMAHGPDADDWGASWAAFIPLEDTVAWDPVPDEAGAWARNIIGVQGTFWSEFTTADAQIEPMLAPRILGVASMAWQKRGCATGDRLAQLAGAYQPILAAMSWQSA